ncbi:hypothetical protein GCM10017559_77260 [Streptosporangium longisporum]|uniref:Uncharacterized protein n=1 Tax=Streptosporangium longisporum TaxID=46187 RepID=A0ABP6LD08_9ACTN
MALDEEALAAGDSTEVTDDPLTDPARRPAGGPVQRVLAPAQKRAGDRWRVETAERAIPRPSPPPTTPRHCYGDPLTTRPARPRTGPAGPVAGGGAVPRGGGRPVRSRPPVVLSPRHRCGRPTTGVERSPRVHS